MHRVIAAPNGRPRRSEALHAGAVGVGLSSEISSGVSSVSGSMSATSSKLPAACDELAVGGTQIDSQGEDAVFERRSGIDEHGVVHEIAFGLLDEVTPLLAADGRKIALAYRLGTLGEALDQRLGVEGLAHGLSLRLPQSSVGLWDSSEAVNARAGDVRRR